MHEHASELGCDERTVRRRLSLIADGFTPSSPDEAVVIMDTTYFGRGFGVSIFIDAITGKVLYRKYVRNETNAEYLAGLDYIRSNDTRVNAVVCDGHIGLLASMGNAPAQMCQFHQIQIIRRLLTSKQRLTAGTELLDLCHRMKRMGMDAFTNEINIWCERWEAFLSERTKLVSEKTIYTHRKLRVTRKSILTYLPWLFTYEDFPQYKIPNTTNSLEGLNSMLKRSLSNHNGLCEKNRIKFIDSFLNSIN